MYLTVLQTSVSQPSWYHGTPPGNYVIHVD
jgi:hypothetical protein